VQDSGLERSFRTLKEEERAWLHTFTDLSRAREAR
jgi:hypothetical protein